MKFNAEPDKLQIETPEQKTVIWIITWTLAILAAAITSTLVVIYLPHHVRLEGLVLGNAAIFVPLSFVYLIAVSNRHSDFSWYFNTDKDRLSCYLGKDQTLIEEHQLSKVLGFLIDYTPSRRRHRFYRYKLLAEFPDKTVELYRSPTATTANRDLRRLQTWLKRCRQDIGVVETSSDNRINRQMQQQGIKRVDAKP